MADTPNMNLSLPTVSSTSGPTWAEQLNTALETIDSHDHSSGKGQKITPTGLNININLPFNDYSPTGVGYVGLSDKTAIDAVDSTVQVKDGELFFIDGASNEVRITSGGAIDVGSVGGIGGDYGTGGSTVFYTDGVLTYFFQDSASAAAKIDVGDISCEDITANNFAGVVNTSAASTGHGVVPIGAVIALNPNLTGAYTTASTTSADSNGWVLVQGQTISDATSPMDGETLPDLTDSRFLRGASTAGTTGGAETFTLVEANLPAHVHDISHGHSDTFATASDSHYHNQVADVENTTGGSPWGGGTYLAQYGSSNDSAYRLRGTNTSPTVARGSTDTHSHTVTGSVTSHTGSSGSAGSDSAVSHIPKFLNVVYVMRIK